MNRNPPKLQFDSIVAMEVDENGTMGQEDPPARRARPSGPSAEIPCGTTYYVETVKILGEHRPFPRRSNDREVAVGPTAGKIPERHGSTLVGDGILRS